MIRIVFVDDDEALLEGLENRLRRMRKKWRMSFLSEPRAVLELLDRQPHDVVVSDMRMPGMDGAQLLQAVQDAHPRTSRIILSGQTSKDGVIRALPVAHQILTKPCDIDDLVQAVEACRTLNEVLHDERVAGLLSAAQRLPVLSEVFHALTEAMKDPEYSLPGLASIVERDVAMTARILQLVNSAHFGIGRSVTSAAEATAYLGVTMLQSLVLSIDLFRSFDERSQIDGFSLSELQQHSLRTAGIAYSLIEDPELRKTAFSSGMLHDVGRLVLAVNHPEFYERVVPLKRAERIDLHQAENSIHGVTHAEVGAVLLSTFGLPRDIVEATAHHHRPERAGEASFSIIGAVHVADRLSHLEQAPPDKKARLSRTLGIDPTYLASVGAEQQIERWRAMIDGRTRTGADSPAHQEATT